MGHVARLQTLPFCLHAHLNYWKRIVVLIQQSRTAENVGNCCQTEQFMGRLKKSLPFLVKKITLLLSFLRKTTAEVRSFSFSKLVTSIVGFYD